MTTYDEMPLNTRNALYRFACKLAYAALRQKGYSKSGAKQFENVVAHKLLHERLDFVESQWIQTGEYAKDI